ncbi:unnamed protein product, partial [Polarella glacialis]
QECRDLCLEDASCVLAVWNCGQSCHLKSGFVEFHTAREHCTHAWLKASEVSNAACAGMSLQHGKEMTMAALTTLKL